MSNIELKSSLGYIWYRLICFLIEISCNISNVGLIRYYDSSINDQSKYTSLIICLIIVSFTIVGSTISMILNLFNDFGNSIEDYPFYYYYKYKTRLKSLSWLSLFDIHIAILIFLPKLIINIQLIKAKIKDQSKLLNINQFLERFFSIRIGSVNRGGRVGRYAPYF